MAYVYSLNSAADFADSIGEAIGGSWRFLTFLGRVKFDCSRSLASEIAASAAGHFNGEFIYEAHGREKDGAVIHAIVTFGEFLQTLTTRVSSYCMFEVSSCTAPPAWRLPRLPPLSTGHSVTSTLSTSSLTARVCPASSSGGEVNQH